MDKSDTKGRLIIIAGATATGKTQLALDLAHRIDAEIISADSMQVYKYMDIGTAKPSEAERMSVRHYLTDEIYPNEDFSIAMFKERASACIKEIQAKGKTPILAGGTNFYINAVINDTEFTQIKPDAGYREYLNRIAERGGAPLLHERLAAVDAKSAADIHINNVKRVIRALEYYHLTGTAISSHNEEQRAKPCPYDYLFLITGAPRDKMYENINKRVDKMMADGFEGEVSRLLEMGYGKNLTPMQGLGYREITRYLDKEITLDEAVGGIKQNTRRFAKRQMTWINNKWGNLTRHFIDTGASDTKACDEELLRILGLYAEAN